MAAAETGEPLAEAQVVLPGVWTATLTDAEGAFYVERLDPGTHTVEIHYLGGRPPPVEAELAPGELTILELELAVDPVALEELEVTVTGRGAERAAA